MIAKLLVFGTVCFALGVWASRVSGAIINKFYVKHFYVPKIVLRASITGDSDTETVAILTDNRGTAKFSVELFNYRNLHIWMDAIDSNLDISKTRLYLHDSASILPYKTGYNKERAAYYARYVLPRPAIVGKSLKIWFFN